MPTFDAPGKAHLDSRDETKPVFLAFFDIDGDPIRATTLGYPVTLPSLADPDLSGQTFYPTSGVLSVGDVIHTEGGSETLAAEMSGLLLPDQDFMNAIGDRPKWQRRKARLWVILRGADRTQIGGIASYYQGEMSSARILPRRDSQVVRMEIEGYKAMLTRASLRGYLDQQRYDSGDLSAAATISSANGARAGPGGVGGGGGLGGFGGSGNLTDVYYAQNTVLVQR